MNATARVTALVPLSCTCWNAAGGAPSVHARSSRRATLRTSSAAAREGACASVMFPRRRPPDLS